MAYVIDEINMEGDRIWIYFQGYPIVLLIRFFVLIPKDQIEHLSFFNEILYGQELVDIARTVDPLTPTIDNIGVQLITPTESVLLAEYTCYGRNKDFYPTFLLMNATHLDQDNFMVSNGQMNTLREGPFDMNEFTRKFNDMINSKDF